MVNSYRTLSLLILFLAFQTSSFAQDEPAAREEFMRIKKLAVGADLIVSGKVEQKTSAWNEAKTRIFTKTTVRVDEYLKGKISDNFIQIIYPGGEVGEVGELYTHMPTFEDHEEVLVFLKKDRNNKDYQVYQGDQGKISVLRDEKTKEKITRSRVRVETLKSQIKRVLETE